METNRANQTDLFQTMWPKPAIHVDGNAQSKPKGRSQGPLLPYIYIYNPPGMASCHAWHR